MTHGSHQTVFVTLGEHIIDFGDVFVRRSHCVHGDQDSVLGTGCLDSILGHSGPLFLLAFRQIGPDPKEREVTLSQQVVIPIFWFLAKGWQVIT